MVMATVCPRALVVSEVDRCWPGRYRDEELELGEVVNFQIPVELDAGRRWLEAGQKLVRCLVGAGARLLASGVGTRVVV